MTYRKKETAQNAVEQYEVADSYLHVWFFVHLNQYAHVMARSHAYPGKDKDMLIVVEEKKFRRKMSIPLQVSNGCLKRFSYFDSVKIYD